MGALSKIREAREILAKAFKELEEGVKEGDPLKVRDSCEKGWLSTVTAVDSLLIKYGYEEAKTHIDRRRKLKELAHKLTDIPKIGLYDRVEARRSILHNDGFYSGILEPEETEEELNKVKRLIEDIETLP